MATFKELNANDIKTSKSFLNQLVDVVQEDVSSSISRKKYQVFVTGGVGPGVTSSLFQTVFDQDFSFQTANPVCDLTVGLFQDSTTVTGASTGVDAAGKLLFPSSSLMMREKIQVYRQYAQVLLGDADEYFRVDDTPTGKIEEAFFVSFKRLFTRDQMKRDTVAIKMFYSAKDDGAGSNLKTTSDLDGRVYTDVNSSANRLQTVTGYQYGTLSLSTDSTSLAGLVFYELGVIVLDLKKVIDSAQIASGTIKAVTAGGTTTIGSTTKFIPDFVRAASIDDIVDHLASCRFGAASQTAITFQNVTQINSTLIFCHASADEFNYSSNPTYVESSGTSKNKLTVIDDGNEGTQQSFTFVTGIGLYDANDNLLAVAKLSRPVEKNAEKDLTFRVRLDY